MTRDESQLDLFSPIILFPISLTGNSSVKNIQANIFVAISLLASADAHWSSSGIENQP